MSRRRPHTRFYVEGEGWQTAGELEEHNQLRTPDGSLVEVLTIQATGKTETVDNIAVADLHNYHVQTSNGTNILVHNECTWDGGVARWRDTGTGQFTTAPQVDTPYGPVVQSSSPTAPGSLR